MYKSSNLKVLALKIEIKRLRLTILHRAQGRVRSPGVSSTRWRCLISRFTTHKGCEIKQYLCFNIIYQFNFILIQFLTSNKGQTLNKHKFGVRYFPKGIFPRATSQLTASQAGTSPPPHCRRLQWVGAEHCGQNRLRDRALLQLGKFHILEVATCENILGKLQIWKIYLWKVPNINGYIPLFSHFIDNRVGLAL